MGPRSQPGLHGELGVPGPPLDFYSAPAAVVSAFAQGDHMKDEEERGSAKLMEMLTGDKAELNEAAMSKAFGVSAEQFIIDRWWLKGQPRPDVFWATLRVKPEFVGGLAGKLIKNGLVVEGFPLGKPGIVDMAGLNVSNLPAAIR